ncbi:cholesin-like isoform X1 [Argopecten irradians]|uniref:cholesin-like isoform X1 n=1 Tax=Argopecten irradians TaxID=31199 RepID=UPI003718D1A2
MLHSENTDLTNAIGHEPVKKKKKRAKNIEDSECKNEKKHSSVSASYSDRLHSKDDEEDMTKSNSSDVKKKKKRKMSLSEKTNNDVVKEEPMKKKKKKNSEKCFESEYENKYNTLGVCEKEKTKNSSPDVKRVKKKKVKEENISAEEKEDNSEDDTGIPKKKRKKKNVSLTETFTGKGSEDDENDSKEETRVPKKKKDKKKKKKNVSFTESFTEEGSGDDENDSQEETCVPKKKKDKKKKKDGKATEEGSDDTNISAQTASINYLKTWSDDNANWKFQKVRQVWLLQHMYDDSKIPNADFDRLLLYLENLKGKGKEETLTKASKIIEAEDSSSDEDDNEDVKTARARQVIQMLT